MSGCGDVFIAGDRLKVEITTAVDIVMLKKNVDFPVSLFLTTIQLKRALSIIARSR